MSGEFARDLIYMEAAELTGKSLDINIRWGEDPDMQTIALKDRPIEIVENLPALEWADLHTPYYSLTDGRVHVAAIAFHKKEWLSIKLSKY